MDKVLKQRLIGASILIALAVIFVPMLFDSPQNDPVSRELDIELPSVPKDRAPIRRLPLDPEQTRATAQGEGSDQAEALNEPIQAPRTRAPGLTESVTGPNRSSDRRPSDARVLDAPETGTDAETASSAGAIEPTQDSADAAVAEDDWQAPVAPSEPASIVPSDPGTEADAQTVRGFEVQVASFGNRENAVALVDRLTRLGHVAEIDIVVRGPSELHRVRTGPYADQGDAERALGQIRQTIQGVNPVIVDSTIASGPATLTDAGFAVQVGSFASRDNALRLLDQLGNQGYEAFIHQDQAGSRRIWRVRVGPLGTRAEAVERLARLTDEVGIDGLVVSHP